MGTSRSWAAVGGVEVEEGEDAKGLLVAEMEDMVERGGGAREAVVVGERGSGARRQLR
jgi:hypothetical protein